MTNRMTKNGLVPCEKMIMHAEKVKRMKMIIGLGNPGQKYVSTKHNIGFIALDEWAYQNKGTFNKNKFDAMYMEQRVNGEKVIFVKPMTFINIWR